MREPKNWMLAALIPSVLTAILAEITDIWQNNGVLVRVIIISVVYLVAILCIYLTTLFWEGWMRSRFDLWNIGKIRGLWQDKGLKRQLKKTLRRLRI